MEKEQRNALRNAVVKARRLLEKEFQEQLEGAYNILPDGQVLENALGDPIVRARLLDVIEHHRVGGAAADEAAESTVREAAFTVLNRFVALKMAERRGLVRECVSQGLQSEGIRELAECAPGLRGALEDGGYHLLLDAVMDEISLDLKVLFHRRDSMAPLWPGPRALDDLLETLNDHDLDDVWAEDEAIGWVYQYFNDNDVKEMRDAAKGGAPRNSRELAVRNQFFTPRYVVEFLTDNTLGRLWYEMASGETALRERCRYLVRRPTEIFLTSGESAPESAVGGESSAEENLSQEELLRQPVHIAHRPLKDPREIRLLDPACGSMHFGLYAFDLFTVIYDEAWNMAHGLDGVAKSAETFAPFVAFAATFPDRVAFLREVPRLIVEHNIHGIDIDPRAAQIAGLSLWLRSQRAWHQAGVKPADRPRITRSNLVCAEPMPGETELLREFVDQQFAAGERPAFAFLLETIFDRMTLAGKAGSLLRIEEEIRTAIADAKQLWKQGPRHVQASLFSEPAEKARQGELRLDLSGITDEEFWERAEQRIYDALEAYAEQAENGGGFQRRLFAADAAQGFAFIDLCRKRYDVVVMNPPFGDVGGSAKDYVFANHLREKTELAACFVTRATQLLAHAGFVGVISNRTFLFADSFQAWRHVYLKGISTCADLGFGVLDALVETAAFVVEQSESRTTEFVALMNSTQKATDLLIAVQDQSNGRVFARQKESFDVLGTEWFYYWLPEGVLAKASQLAARRTSLLARPGLQTCDNFRFVRLAWEPAKDSRFSSAWFRLSKGGEYQPFWADVHLVTLWEDDGKEMKAFIEGSYDSWSKQIPSVDLYTLSGLTYSERTTSSLSLRVFPGGCLFDKQGPFVGYKDVEAHDAEITRFLGFSYCYLFRALVESHVGLRDATEAGSPARHYMPSMIERLPLPELSEDEDREMAQWVNGCIGFHRALAAFDPTNSSYCALPEIGKAEGITAYQQAVARQLVEAMKSLYGGLARADRKLRSAFQLQEEDLERLEEFFGPSAAIEVVECQSDDRGRVALLLALPEAELVAMAAAENGNFSSILKQSFVANRRLELASLCLRCTPASLLDELSEFDWLLPRRELAPALCDLIVGALFGRWDIRYATGDLSAPELPDPFVPLPVCAPGMLQGDDGLPLSPEVGRRLRAEHRYPLDVAWDGILVDDPEHPFDLERRARTALAVIWGDRADALEREACALLGVPTLREWFRRPGGFFADHLKRYSKSRRKAPIYWPLSTASGSYTIWLYYHRITADTLFQLVTEYLEPKLRKTRAERQHIEAGQAKAEGRESAKLAKRAGELIALEQELEEMKVALLRVAELPYKPDLNDGVQITAAPLSKLFRLPKWRKALETTWKKLEKGEYEWAHLAYAIWPERVREKCKTDRSLAIAHGLEDLCEVEVKPKKRRRKKSNA